MPTSLITRPMMPVGFAVRTVGAVALLATAASLVTRAPALLAAQPGGPARPPAALAASPLDEALWDAARRGDTAAITAALANGARVDAPNRYGGTALMFAAGQGHLEAVRLLVERGADVNARDSFYGIGVLQAALMNDRLEVATFLLGRGVKDAAPALMTAVERKNVGLARAALESKAVDPRSLASAAVLAARSGNDELAALVKAAADANPVPARVPVGVPSQVLQSYTGSYRSEASGFTVSVSLKDGRLVGDTPGQPLLTLVPTSQSSFESIEVPDLRLTFGGRGGTVEHLQLEQGERTMVLSRVVADPSSPVHGGTPGSATTGTAAPRAAGDDALRTPRAAGAPRPWPSFRGERASGNGDGQGAVVEWDVASGTNVKWRTEVPGIANASPIVWGDRVFVTTAISAAGDKTFRTGLYGDVAPVDDLSEHTWKVYALHKQTGRVAWERDVFTGAPRVKRHTKASQANATPVTDGTRVVSLFGSIGVLVAHDAATGEELWRRDLGVLDSGWFFDPAYQWGHSSSPIVYGSSVIVQADQQKGSYLAAFDIATGKDVWRTPREDEISTWGTPTIATAGDRDVLVTNGTTVRGYDPRTGALLWSVGPNSEITGATPVAGPDLVYVTGGYPPVRPVYAIKPGATGQVVLAKGQTSHEALAWSNDREGTYIPTPLLYQGILYTCNNNGIVTAYDAATGERIYRARVGGGGAFSASPVAADGRLYFTSEDGEVYVVKAGREYVELAKNAMNAVVMATPAISDGLIVVRTIGHVYALGRP